MGETGGGDSELTFFDTCVRIGRSRAPDPPGNVADAGRLLECMRRHHVAGAAVEHAVAMEASPRLGHAQLQEDIGAHEELRPAWHLMPAVSDRIEQAVTDPAELLSHRVALGRVDAKDFCNGRGDQACFAPVLEACEAVHLPVFLDFRRQGDLMGFDFDICRRFPGIPFVAEAVGGYPFHRTVWCLREYENLHVSTVNMGAFNGVAMLCELAGVERVIFGSHWPAANIGMALGHVVFAGVPQADRQRIAADNFLGLLRKVGT